MTNEVIIEIVETFCLTIVCIAFFWFLTKL